MEQRKQEIESCFLGEVYLGDEGQEAHFFENGRGFGLKGGRGGVGVDELVIRVANL
jgi:hypothetical protein